MVKKSHLLVSLFILVAFSGCVSSGTDVTPFLRQMPMIQQFLADHPNADISIIYLDQNAITKDIDSIRAMCGESFPVAPYYKAVYTEGSIKMTLFIETKDYKPICIKKEGTNTGEPKPPTYSEGGLEIVDSFCDATKGSQAVIRNYNRLSKYALCTEELTGTSQECGDMIIQRADGNAMKAFFSQSIVGPGETVQFYDKNCVEGSCIYIFKLKSKDAKTFKITINCNWRNENGENTCKDSDGGSNYYEAGYVESSAGMNKDFCLDKTTVAEYSCDGNQAKKEAYKCPEACFEGRCTKGTGDNPVTGYCGNGVCDYKKFFIYPNSAYQFGNIVVKTGDLGYYPYPKLVVNGKEITVKQGVEFQIGTFKVRIKEIVTAMPTTQAASGGGSGQSAATGMIVSTSTTVAAESTPTAVIEEPVTPIRVPVACGDGICSVGETGVCTKDCGAVCGNGICEPGEASTSTTGCENADTECTGLPMGYKGACQADCPSTQVVAYIVIEIFETKDTCQKDCGGDQYCRDSDGGRNYYQAGYVEYNGGKLEDHCNSDGTLTEKYCDGGTAKAEQVKCPQGNCSQGACPQVVVCTADAKLCPDGTAVGRIPPNCEFAPCPSTNCTDTDGGRIYSVKGVVRGPAISWTNDDRREFEDSCVDFGIGATGQVVSSCATGNSNCKVDEYYCQEGVIYYEYVLCQNGCTEGRCITNTTGRCGNGILESGEECDDGNANNYNDGCLSSCQKCAAPGLRADIYGGSRQQCCSGLVLQGGVCNVPVNQTNTTNTCTDSDGGQNYVTYGYTYGYRNGASYTNYDICTNSNYLAEFYCLGDYSYNVSYSCPNGCSDGKCNSANQTNTTNTCTDSDGGLNYNVLGYTSGHESNGSYTNYDSCSFDGITLREFYCSGQSSQYAYYDCPYGCSEGKCSTAAFQNSCNDSDGGLNYTVYGYISGNKNNIPYTYYDICLNNNTLSENYCSGVYGYNATYTCPNGCNESRCL